MSHAFVLSQVELKITEKALKDPNEIEVIKEKPNQFEEQHLGIGT